MTIWTGFITDKLRESRNFYCTHFGATVLWEADWFVLLRLGESQLGFLAPGHPSQAPIFQAAFTGQGAWLTIDVADVETEHARLSAAGVPVVVSLRSEAWGDRHFAIVDPSGIAIDIVTRTA